MRFIDFDITVEAARDTICSLELEALWDSSPWEALWWPEAWRMRKVASIRKGNPNPSLAP
jgi:hypothetical protein